MYTLIEEEMARLRDEGRRRGRREGSRTLLEHQVGKKFGADGAGQLSDLIGGLDGRDELDAAADAVIECDTVLPIFVHVGTEPWTAPTRLEDLLADEAKAFLPFALGH